MKILFLSELFYPHGGGAEYASFLIAKILAGAGHQVRVVTNIFTDEPEKSLEEGITVIRKNLLRNLNSVKYSMLINMDIFFQKWMTDLIDWADIVYVPRYWYSSIPFIKKSGRPLIVHLHDYIPLCPVANLFDPRSKRVCEEGGCSSACVYSYERFKGNSRFHSMASSILNSTIGRYMGWMIKGSDAIICVSNNQKKLLVNKSPELDGKTTVIYNPLPDLELIPMNRKGFAYFGGPSPLKGFQVLVQSIAYVRNESFRIKATGFEDNNERKIGPIDKRMEIMNWVTGEDLVEVYSDIHTVIVPSIIPEPAPYVVYEAILRGRLVIGSRIGGIPEQLKGYKGCQLFEPGDHYQLADKIDAMLEVDVDEAQEIASYNREKLVREDHNRKMLESFEGLMNRLLN
jgi:glycosyltransferase involved in cell wall biosynthesis